MARGGGVDSEDRTHRSCAVIIVDRFLDSADSDLGDMV
jgi:hypothetical protein